MMTTASRSPAEGPDDQMNCPELRFPLAGPVPWEPAPVYAKLREEFPVAPIRLPTGVIAWLVTRYADTKTVLSDRRFSRAAAAAPGAPRGRAVPLESRAITTMDPPEHSRLRRLVAPAFSPRRVEQLRPAIQRIAGEQLGRLTRNGPPADLVGSYAQPVALRVICELLGVPEADRLKFQALTEDYLSTSSQPGHIAAAATGLSGYIGELVAAKRAFPGSGLMDLLVSACEEDRVSEGELVALGVTLLVAGYQTAANEIVNTVLALFRHPGQLAAARAMGSLDRHAVEELLRYTLIATTGGTLRVSLEDTSLSGVAIGAGDPVMPAITSANRDPSVFADPDRLDLSRQPNPHLAFGHGPHHCLGAHLARAEVEIAVSSLLRGLPGLEPAGRLTAAHWNTAKTVQGPRELKITW
jgi:nocardicin N-oxygenase